MNRHALRAQVHAVVFMADITVGQGLLRLAMTPGSRVVFLPGTRQAGGSGFCAMGDF